MDTESFLSVRPFCIRFFVALSPFSSLPSPSFSIFLSITLILPFFSLLFSFFFFLSFFPLFFHSVLYFLLSLLVSQMRKFVSFVE